MQNGITSVVAFKPKKEESSFTFPSEMKLRDDCDLAQKLKCDDILPSRSLDGSNTPQLSAPDSEYYQSQFVHVAKIDGTPEEEDTPENAAQFAKGIADFLHENGTSGKQKFMTRFQYSGDLTPPGEDLPPPAKYFLDSDVVSIIKYIYPNTPLTDIAEDDDTVASFFGDDRLDEGHHLLIAQAEYESAVDLEGGGDDDGSDALVDSDDDDDD
jgi:hypothetical protein